MLPICGGAYDETSIYNGTEKPLSLSDSECAIFKEYSVFTKNDDEDAGENIKVYKGSTCDPKKSKKILDLKNDMGRWFAGLYESYLFVDNGTGPDGRVMEIYDLLKKKLIYSASYSSKEDPRIRNDNLIFYKDLEGLVDKEELHCPDAKKFLLQSLGYGFEQKTEVDLKSMSEKAIDKISCSVRQ